MIQFHDVTPFGYSDWVTVDLGNATMITISGQTAIDKMGNTLALGDFAGQADIVFAKLKTILATAGGSFADVVKFNYYLSNMENIIQLRAVRNGYINTSHPPASTAVQVAKLFKPDLLLEVEAVAVIAHKRS